MKLNRRKKIIFSIPIALGLIFLLLVAAFYFKQDEPKLHYLRHDPMSAWEPRQINGNEKDTYHPAETGGLFNVEPTNTASIERNIPVKIDSCSEVLGEAKANAESNGWTIDYYGAESFTGNKPAKSPASINLVVSCVLETHTLFIGLSY